MQAHSSFMLIFRDTTPEKYEALSPEERKRSLDKWNAWYDGIAAAGQMHHGHPLQSAGRVVSKRRGETVFDGPFSEAKETIGGYFLISARDIEEATEIAGRCPNLDFGMTVEVRPVATMCHLASELGMTSMRS
ncbi:MAG TPA: YciI family protein [Caulifigura sp.]|nr:YciI family protein [Caulifigura sp.]